MRIAIWQSLWGAARQNGYDEPILPAINWPSVNFAVAASHKRRQSILIYINFARMRALANQGNST